MMRLLHLLVIGALVASAAYVYKIKFDSTVRAERVARLRAEIKRERDSVVALRARWETLDSPARIQGLAERHLALKPLDPNQIDALDHLPERPQSAAAPGDPDPIASIIENDNQFPAESSRPENSQAEPAQ
jgi:cell division protein FtsL